MTGRWHVEWRETMRVHSFVALLCCWSLRHTTFQFEFFTVGYKQMFIFRKQSMRVSVKSCPQLEKVTQSQMCKWIIKNIYTPPPNNIKIHNINCILFTYMELKLSGNASKWAWGKVENLPCEPICPKGAVHTLILNPCRKLGLYPLYLCKTYSSATKETGFFILIMRLGRLTLID